MKTTRQRPIITVPDEDAHPQRTHTCGELRPEHVGRKVVLKGWVDTYRDLGGVLFVDLRDRYGFTQIVFSPQDERDAYEQAGRLRSEYVISIRGTVGERSEDTINPKIPTGQVEVRVRDMLILNVAEPIPFMVSAHEEKRTEAGEDLRLRYRYLDLRRPELRDLLILRHKTYRAVRQYFDRNGFVEVETPVLMKSTPEGARDYLVPSRIHPGKFYALPQSPQTYKQLLMVAGLDRYFQIVKCFRDEDLRADRQPEFTQIDAEITFPDEGAIYAIFEGLMQKIWKDVLGIDLPGPFPRLTWRQAVERYGSDRPDLRFGMEIQNVSKVFEGSGFRVFDHMLGRGGHILALVAKGQGDWGRARMDRLDKEIVRRKIGASGLIYFKLPADGSPRYSSVKEHVLPTECVEACVEATGAEHGDLILVLAGPDPGVHFQMGKLRLHVADATNLIPGHAEAWRFAWVHEFPLLEWNPDARRFLAVHHPFTAPHPDDVETLEAQPENVRARAYDLVLNGVELGGGSIRVHTRAMQHRIFELLGIDEDEARRRFGFLLNAFRYGAPPHGGIAFGLDRIVMALAGTSNIRDVIAFPKTQTAQEPMVNSPDTVNRKQLDELHVAVVADHEQDPPTPEGMG